VEKKKTQKTPARNKKQLASLLGSVLKKESTHHGNEIKEYNRLKHKGNEI
jgi:hypothetical protein